MGAGAPEEVGRIGGGDGNHFEASGDSGFDSGERIFKNDDFRRFPIKGSGRLQKNVGHRFPGTDAFFRDDSREVRL